MVKTKLIDVVTPPDNANGAWYRQRGRVFENILNSMLSSEEMEPRTSMRPTGEEIDGSFAFGNNFFLLEAKWHANPIPASSIYAFTGKVDGKLIGTIGVFFSMSDYSKDAVDALVNGKELNIILFGHNDLLAIENGSITLREALRLKLRYAVEYGQPFYPLETVVKRKSKTERNNGETNQEDAWSIIVEGEEDVQTISSLLGRCKRNSDFSVFAAGGQRSVASLAKSIVSNGSKRVAAIVTPIEDKEVQAELTQQLTKLNVETVFLDRSIEDWLGEFVSTEYFNATSMLTNNSGKMARRYARNADIDRLLSESESFAKLVGELKVRE